MRHDMGIGREFQEVTKYVRGKIPAGYYSTKEAPAPFKAYPGARTVPLPPPPSTGGMTLWEVLSKRRSGRTYADSPLSAQDLSCLLWAACGATRQNGDYLLRTAPSAGALYPIETYVGIRKVVGVSGGLYHYAVRDHALALLREGDFSDELAGTALDQTMVGDAGVVFLWTAVFGRSTVKYLERAYRYVYLDAGHIAENLLLASTARGLSACPIAALYDDEVNAILGIDGDEESILYMASVGAATDGAQR
jgi:SagB-type dehydrogenase family enzyme